MSFKDFIINYFSPVFFILRCFLVWVAFFCYVFLPFFLFSSGISETVARFISLGLALYFLYKALKPWRVGMTIGQAMDKYKKFINKH